jgi:hypothetical protein
MAGVWCSESIPLQIKNSSFMQNMVPTPELDGSFEKNINFLELIAACVAILVWAPNLAGASVIIESDNASTVSFMQRCTTKNLAAIAWLKLVFACSMKYDFYVTARHTPGKLNIQADALSRLTERDSYAKIFQRSFESLFPGPKLPLNFLCSYPQAKTGKTCGSPALERNGRNNEENPENAVAVLRKLLPSYKSASSSSYVK